MSFAVWNILPPFAPQPGSADRVYQVGTHWVVTDDPLKATQPNIDAALAAARFVDVPGFLSDVIALFGGAVAINTVAKQYPVLLPALNNGNWPVLQALIVDANTKALITPTQYAAIKAAVTARNIPITLP